MKIGRFTSNRLKNAGSGLTAAGSYTITGLWNFTHATGLKVGGTAITAAKIANWDAALPTTGGTLSGNVKFEDDVVLGFGDSNDFRVFFNGSHLYIDQENSTAYDIYIRDTTPTVQFHFDVSAGGFHATGEVEAYDTSDLSIKDDLQDIDPKKALEALRRWRSVSYFNKEKKRRDIGFIAQEVEKDFPEAVKTRPDGLKMIHYGKLDAVIGAAIKALANG